MSEELKASNLRERLIVKDTAIMRVPDHPSKIKESHMPRVKINGGEIRVERILKETEN